MNVPSARSAGVRRYRPGCFREAARLGGDGHSRLLVGVVDRRHEERVGRVDGDADVDAFVLVDFAGA